MNSLQGEIESIQAQGALSLVKIMVPGAVLSTVVIDTPATAPYLVSSGKIQVLFKETEVIIAKGADLAISLQNRLPGVISSIEHGELLGKLTIETQAGKITSIITTNAIRQLELVQGDRVTAMIKTNEIMLSP